MIINLVSGFNEICSLAPGKRYTFKLTTGADFTATLTPCETDFDGTYFFTAAPGEAAKVTYEFDNVAETTVGFEFVATKRGFSIDSSAAVVVDVEVVLHA